MGLSPLEVGLRVLTPGILFSGGVVLLYYAAEDILDIFAVMKELE